MLSDDDLRAIIAEHAAMSADSPLRNERSLAMAAELLERRSHEHIHRQEAAAVASGWAPRSENSASISAWQDETFGPATTTWERIDRSDAAMRGAMWRAKQPDLTIPRPNLSRAIRAAEELAELITLLVANDADPKAPEECADVDIVLRGIDRFHGVERAAAVDAKMAKNRARTWTVTGDGHGQHVEHEP